MYNPELDSPRRHVHVPTSRVTGHGVDATKKHVHQSSTRVALDINYDHIITVMEARIRKQEIDFGLTPDECMPAAEVRLKASGMAAGRVSSMAYYRAAADAKARNAMEPCEAGYRWEAIEDDGMWKVGVVKNG